MLSAAAASCAVIVVLLFSFTTADQPRFEVVPSGLAESGAGDQILPTRSHLASCRRARLMDALSSVLLCPHAYLRSQTELISTFDCASVC